jgi:hypothetical protein
MIVAFAFSSGSPLRSSRGDRSVRSIDPRHDEVLLDRPEPYCGGARGAPHADQITSWCKRSDAERLRSALRGMHRGDLPPQYATPEALAESDLVVWLMHANELGAPPDAIELVKTIERPAGAPGQNSRYYVFRFRTNPPHWAASSGWMAGVAGPYADGDEAFDTPAAGVFSKFEAFESRSPEDHLAAIEQMTDRA